MDHLETIRERYRLAKRACAKDWSSQAAGQALRDLAVVSLTFLRDECHPVDLVSLVPGKQYLSYARKGQPAVVSRPANSTLFVAEPALIAQAWEAALRGHLERPFLDQVCYTAALAPCLTMELFDRQNKKGPATYFECLIGHIFASALTANPTRRATLSVRGQAVKMTMDFLFDLPNGVKVHLPVKMSTRERVVQAWAHQRLLSSAYGEGTYRGIMILFSETKLDSRSHEVVEICVPGQWLAYQTLLARMVRVYYFDLPHRYQELTDQFSDVIQVRPFGDFFTERDSVLAAAP